MAHLTTALAADAARVRRARRLTEDDLAADWPAQFARWFADAVGRRPARAERDDRSPPPTGTAGPSARTVLLKGYDERGFVFFTNYDSRKGAELRRQPVRRAWSSRGSRCSARCASTARCEPVEPGRDRGVLRAPGRAARSSAPGRARSRPVVAGRGPTLDAGGRAPSSERFAGDGPVPPPPHWGGLRVVPETVEFWQGRQQPAARPAALPPDRRGELGRRAARAVSEASSGRSSERHAIDVRPLRVPGVPAAVRRQRASPSSASSSPRSPCRCRCTPSRDSSLWVGLLGVAGARPAAGLRALGRRGRRRASTGARLLLASSALMWVATLGLLAQALLGLRQPAGAARR